MKVVLLVGLNKGGDELGKGLGLKTVSKPMIITYLYLYSILRFLSGYPLAGKGALKLPEGG